MPEIPEKCPNCGGSVHMTPGVRDLRCNFCGRDLSGPVYGAAPQQPPQAQQQWHAVAPFTASSSGMPIALAFTGGLAVLGVVVAGVFFAARSRSSGSYAATTSSSDSDTLPITCPTNGSVHISGKTFAGSGTLIDAGLNCEVTIENSKLKGDVVVKGGLNTKLNIVHSTLEGTDTALDMGQNGEIKVSGDSEIRGKTAISGRLNVKLNGDHVKIIGGETGFAGGQNAEIELHHGEIFGKKVAFESSGNANVTLDDAFIHSDKIAMSGENLLQVTAQKSRIEGVRAGLHGEMNMKVKLKDKSKISAREDGIDGGLNLEVTMEDSTIDGGIAIKATDNTKVKAESSHITGVEAAIRVKLNLKLDLEKTTIEAKNTAVQGVRNAEIDARGGAISGGKNAFSFEAKPSSLNLKGTKVSGAEDFDGGKDGKDGHDAHEGKHGGKKHR